MKLTVRTAHKLIDFLKGELSTDRSTKYLRKVLEANLCRVNGKIERFASTRLDPGDLVELSPSWEKMEAPPSSIPVIFEDEFFKVVDKPPSWVCSDESAFSTFGANHFLIHRLDRDTSGLLLIAKTLEVKQQFIELFESKKIAKLYLALSDGIFLGQKLKKESFFVKKGVFQGQTIWGSAAKGQYASTLFRKIAVGHQATLFACQPITGRTHQIRVHLAELGHPLLIDRQYAENFRCRHFFQRTLLHAFRLKFTHPITGAPMDLSSPLPGDMRSAIHLVGIEPRHLSEFLGEQEKSQSREESHQNKQTKEVIKSSYATHQSR